LRLPAARKVIALRLKPAVGGQYMPTSCAPPTDRGASGCSALSALVSRETRAVFEEAVYAAGAGDLPLSILFGHAREAIAACDVALVASGTATLETALARKPMVITYKMAELTYRLMKRMGYIPWVGLPNVIAGEFVVPEILQHDATPENLAQALLNSLNDPVVTRRPRTPGVAASRRDTASRVTSHAGGCRPPDLRRGWAGRGPLAGPVYAAAVFSREGSRRVADSRPERGQAPAARGVIKRKRLPGPSPGKRRGDDREHPAASLPPCSAR
jgi:hypothetical protein